MSHKTAIVTGGNRGIGLAITKILMESPDIRVILTARDSEKGQVIADELDVEFMELDVSSSSSIERFVNEFNEQVGELDFLINNAGIWGGENQTFPDIELSLLYNVLDTNLFGPILLTQGLLPLLKKSGDARVINVSSGLGQMQDVGSGSSCYRISKAALNMFSANAAAVLKDTNVKVVAVCPGWVKTDMGGENANLTPSESATHITNLLTDKSLQTGEFYRFEKIVGW